MTQALESRSLNKLSLIPYHAPRIKPAHMPLRGSDGVIQLGGDVYGIAGVIDDPDGWMWSVLQLLDGTRTPMEIVKASERPPDDVAELLAACYRAGHLEDAASTQETTLSHHQRERYSRTQRFFQWIDTTPRPSVWSVQELISAARVTIVGIGGAGTHAATLLAASGVGSLKLVDPDRVELSNLSRQTLFTEADVGKPKADAAAFRLRELNSTISIEPSRDRITTAKEFTALADGCDVLALCADEPTDIRKWANLALANQSPWVTGGYRGPVVDVRVHAPGNGPCHDCLRHARYGEPDPSLEGNDLSNSDIASSSAVSASLTGTLLAHGVLMLITHAPTTDQNFAFGVNLAGLDQNLYLAPGPRPECEICGTANGDSALQPAAHPHSEIGNEVN